MVFPYDLYYVRLVLDFDIQECLANDDLSIVATNWIGERIKGKVTLDKSNGEFECTVLPRSRG